MLSLPVFTAIIKLLHIHAFLLSEFINLLSRKPLTQTVSEGGERDEGHLARTTVKAFMHLGSLLSQSFATKRYQYDCNS